MDDWDYTPPLIWNEAPSDFQPGPDQAAFAAYEDAWVERDASGRTSPDILIAALKARKVPARDYAAGTRLHSVLFDSWDKGRRPKHMHPTILKYRLGKVRGVRNLFRNSLPEEMRHPQDVRRAGKLFGDDTTLPFRPTGTFAARIAGWYDAVDDDDRDRDIPVWLDTASRPQKTPVMIGRELAGYVDLPPKAHARLVGATKKGRRLVAMGDLRVSLRNDGTYKAKKVTVVLPERKG